MGTKGGPAGGRPFRFLTPVEGESGHQIAVSELARLLASTSSSRRTAEPSSVTGKSIAAALRRMSSSRGSAMGTDVKSSHSEAWFSSSMKALKKVATSDAESFAFNPNIDDTSAANAASGIATMTNKNFNGTENTRGMGRASRIALMSAMGRKRTFSWWVRKLHDLLSIGSLRLASGAPPVKAAP